MTDVAQVVDKPKKKVARTSQKAKKLSRTGCYVKNEETTHFELAPDGVGIVKVEMLGEENGVACSYCGCEFTRGTVKCPVCSRQLFVTMNVSLGDIRKESVIELSKLLSKYSDAINYGSELVRPLSDGSDIDIDAAVDETIDQRGGCGTGKIFEETKITDSRNKICVYLLVDCSGSMKQDHKIDLARKTVYIIGEFLDKLGIKFAIEGFNDCEIKKRVNADITEYLNKLQSENKLVQTPSGLIHENVWVFPKILSMKNFSQRWDGTKKKIVNLMAANATPDATAIWRAGKILAKQKEEKKVLMVICDGDPNSMYFKNTLNGAFGTRYCDDEFTKQAVKEVRAMGIDVICINVDDRRGSNVKEIYEKDFVQVPPEYMCDETLAILSEKLDELGVGRKMPRPSVLLKGKMNKK